MPMLRDQFNEAMKAAMKARDQATLAAVRLIIAKMKELDISLRPKGVAQASDADIVQMLQGMIKQRRESIALYVQGGRQELADAEAAEIAVIERFLPPQMTAEALDAAMTALIAELGAATVKDMGRVVAAARERYAGQMDAAAAAAVIKAKLGG